MWEKVRRNTKKAESIIDSVHYSIMHYGIRDIEQAYKNPSDTKKEIFNDWWKTSKDLKAQYITVVSASCYTFTVAFVFTDYENTCKRYLAYITPTHNYLIELNLLELI